MSSAARHRVKSWRRYRVNMLFSSQPQFCCGCLCLAPDDARRMRRVFSIVRQITRPTRPGRTAAGGRGPRSGGSIGGGGTRAAAFPAQLGVFTAPSNVLANSAQAVSEGFSALVARLRGSR